MPGHVHCQLAPVLVCKCKDGQLGRSQSEESIPLEVLCCSGRQAGSIRWAALIPCSCQQAGLRRQGTGGVAGTSSTNCSPPQAVLLAGGRYSGGGQLKSSSGSRSRQEGTLGGSPLLAAALLLQVAQGQRGRGWHPDALGVGCATSRKLACCRQAIPLSAAVGRGRAGGDQRAQSPALICVARASG